MPRGKLRNNKVKFPRGSRCEELSYTQGEDPCCPKNTSFLCLDISVKNHLVNADSADFRYE